MFVCLSVGLLLSVVCLIVCFPACLFIYLFVCLFVCLFVYSFGLLRVCVFVVCLFECFVKDKRIKTNLNQLLCHSVPIGLFLGETAASTALNFET
jgi:hypothetical protein